MIVFLPAIVFSQVQKDSVSILRVDSLLQVSKDLTSKDDFDMALEVNILAEKICLEKLDKTSASFGRCCYNHGLLLYLKGDYLQAQPWYLNALDIQEMTIGKEHPSYIETEHDLAAVYMETGSYEKAELLFQNARNAIEKTLGKKHQDYAGSLFSLAVLYYQMSNFQKAEPLFIEAKNIHAATLGKETSSYTKTIEALAALYDEMGDYERAEPLFIEAKNIWLKRVGAEDPDYAISIYNLSILYVRMGNYRKAEPLMLEAKGILQKVWGEEHPDFATILDGLAQVYEDLGEYVQAEPYLIQAKEIRQKSLGSEHNLYAQSLHNLGVLYFLMGNYEKAESLFLDAKEVEEKAIGKDQPDYAMNLHQLADLYALNKNFIKAEPLYLEAKAIREKILGKEHPDYAQSLNDLAILYQDKGEFLKAEQFFIELSVLGKIILQKALNHLSEKELNNYLVLFSKRQDEALSFLQLSTSKNMSSTCYDNCLFYKGFLLNASSRIKKIANTESKSSEKFNLLQSYERRLAVQYSKPIAERDSLSLNQLETKTNDLEKDLAISLAAYGEVQQQVRWNEIKQKLKANEASIEFVRYKFNEKLNDDKTMYAALLLQNGYTQPEFVSLFEEKQLDSLLKSSGGRKADYVNNLYSFAQRGATFIEQPQKSLYDLLWKSLDPYLKDVTTIYYSPAGLLHRLNLGAIAISEDQTLGDKYQLIQLKSTRQLVEISETSYSTNDAVLFGGIEFDLDSSMLKDNLNGNILFASRGINELLGFEKVDTSLRNNYPVMNSDLEKKHVSKKSNEHEVKTRGGAWNYLPGTEKEISIIEKILLISNISVKSKKGYEATEEAFKKIGQNGNLSPRILHLATHGYFFPDAKTSTNENQHLINASEPVFKISDHPMLRSGLILAGGNSAWHGAKTLEGHEDGILTAYEISQMNLANTELVVLSACETGLGDIQGNEGVYGLQRAFKIAGAKYLIMSLWQVPDKQTSELMRTFYQKWLIDKLSLPEAFREAQKEMRERFVDPYAWAGFVLVE